MPIMCMDCFQVYEIDHVKFDACKGYCNRCPKIECSGCIVKLDELIVPIVKILNQKGYTTKYCCSGHSYDIFEAVNFYIMFERGIRIPEELPANFIRESNNTIRKSYKNNKENDEIPLHYEILNTVADVLSWAIRLEE